MGTILGVMGIMRTICVMVLEDTCLCAEDVVCQDKWRDCFTHSCCIAVEEGYFINNEERDSETIPCGRVYLSEV